MLLLTDDTKQNAESWFNRLEEGVIVVEGGQVSLLNRAAANFLGVDQQRSLRLPLIGVLRDHRLEQSFLNQKPLECQLRGRTIVSLPFAGGLLLQDVSQVRESRANARELLAVLSHELRTPVSIIRSTLEALQEDMPDELRKRFVAKALDESDRLVRLLEDLTADVKPPRFRSFDLSDAAKRAVQLVQASFDRRNIRLETKFNEVAVFADLDKLLQVFINLLDNAAKHGPGEACVRFEVFEREGFAHAVVQDEGQPLDSDRVEELFEPYARASKVKAKGTGLGLYIVKNIIGQLGGEVWVHSFAKEHRQGNEFGISLPCKTHFQADIVLTNSQ